MSPARFMPQLALCAFILSASAANEGSQKDPGLKAVAAPVKSCTDPVLHAAKILADDGQFERAEAVVAPLLAERSSAICASEAMTQIRQQRRATILEDRLEDFVDSVTRAAAWVLPLALICFCGIVFRLFSFLHRKGQKAPWKVRNVAPGSDEGVVAAWRSALAEELASVRTAPGLLSLGRMPLPRAYLAGGVSSPDISSILDAAPEIGGVSGSWLGRLIKSLIHVCQSPRRTASVLVTSSERSILLRVNLTDEDGRFRSVAVARSWGAAQNSAEEINAMAGEMAIRTAYLMAGKVLDGPLDARVKLQEGLGRLNDFVMRHESAALSQAARAFEETRRIDPADLDAAMLEGIVRELQQQPERAASLFQFVIDRTEQDTERNGRARYNLAISYLRQYTVASIEKAELLLTALLADSNVTSSELIAFSRAALANLLAHKFIFWHQIEATGKSDFSEWPLEQRQLKQTQLLAWSNEFDTQLSKATTGLNEKTFPVDSAARTQLQWLIENAKGNLALNQANSATKPLGLDVDAQKKSEKLETALAAFRRCEALIPAGVETLTNIATTLLALKRPSEAISYTQQARTLNPAYEYAYYREAKALLDRDEREKCKAFLASADSSLGSIAIPSFKKIFEDLGVKYHADQ